MGQHTEFIQRLRARASTKAVAERAMRGTPEGEVLADEIADLTRAADLIEIAESNGDFGAGLAVGMML